MSWAAITDETSHAFATVWVCLPDDEGAPVGGALIEDGDVTGPDGMPLLDATHWRE